MRECPAAVTEEHLAGLGSLLDRLEADRAVDPPALVSELGTAVRVLENPAGLSYRMVESRFLPLRDRIARLRERARGLAAAEPPRGR
jgi:hypothetical protein